MKERKERKKEAAQQKISNIPSLNNKMIIELVLLLMFEKAKTNETAA